MKIVTSGSKFLDIDAYAGCIAYAELLRLKGEDAIAFSSATINDSVPDVLRSWDAPIFNKYKSNDEDTFILIDASEPDCIEDHVNIDKVEEVIDHHFGYEEFWQKRIGNKTNIEFIGASCTQVYEKWVTANLADSLTETSARLLICGILDNTLNFKANVTTSRDKIAYKELLKIANLANGWPERYFSECQKAIFKDIKAAITNDTKIMQLRNMSIDRIAFGQLVIWDAGRAITDYRPELEQAMEKMSDNWFINIVSIDEGNSYFLSSNSIIEEWATKVLDVNFNDNLARADRLWLRKEIFKQDQLYGL